MDSMASFSSDISAESLGARALLVSTPIAVLEPAYQTNAQMLWTERKLRDEYTSEHCDTRVAGLQLLFDKLNALIDALDEP